MQIMLRFLLGSFLTLRTVAGDRYMEATAVLAYPGLDNEPALGLFNPLAYKTDKNAALEGVPFVGHKSVHSHF